MNKLQQAKEKVSDAAIYWRRPPKGRYMPFKEIAAYSLGGNGIYLITCMYNYIALTATSVFLGNTIGIAPTHMYIMYVIASLLNIPLTAFRANIVDNVKNRAGKYRPWLVSMGIPAAFLCLLFVWMPYEGMTYIAKCVTIFILSTLILFFYNFFFDSYESLIYVLSPNTIERTDVAAVKAIFYSLAPSIINAVMPLIAGAISNGNLYDLKVYRVAFPPIAILGIVLTIIVYANTKEKIVQAKTHTIKISFFTALKAVAKNKYFWIISLAGWVGFLEGCQGNILQWLYNYRQICSPTVYSIVTLVVGNASFWGMLVAPFLVRKYGKRKVLIASNLLNIVFIAMIYPARESMPWVTLCFWLNFFAGALALIFNPGIQADIRDYQHWKTGERIDGMFAAVGLIGSIVTMFTSGVLPFLYEKLGIYEGNGYENMYDILYNEADFDKIIGALILFATIGATLNVIPLFFYDLKETTQQGIIRVLKIRAMFEDYGNGVLDDKTIVEAVDIINHAEEFAQNKPKDISRHYWSEQKKNAKTKEEKKAVKLAHKKAVEHNAELEICSFVVEELHKFDNEEMKMKLKVAKETYAKGYDCVYEATEEALAAAKALPKTNKLEKNYRKEEIESAKAALSAKKLALKHYPDGIKEFDTSVFDELFEKDDQTDLAITEKYKEYNIAKKAKDTEKTEELKAEINKLKLERKEVKEAINKANKEYTLFTNASIPYINARKLIVQAENYRHLDEISAQYEVAKERSEAADKAAQEEEDRLAAELKAEKERLKEEKKRLKAEKKAKK